MNRFNLPVTDLLFFVMGLNLRETNITTRQFGQARLLYKYRFTFSLNPATPSAMALIFIFLGICHLRRLKSAILRRNVNVEVNWRHASW